MAMINCPECGQEISDKEKKCIQCGYPLEDEKVEETVTIKKKKGNLKKIVIPIVIIAIIVTVVFGIINFIGSSLNEDEQLAYQNAVEMKSMMLAPDSFELYDEMFLLKHRDDEGNVDYIYTIFKYGAVNGHGAITTKEAIFKDGEYIMDYADEPVAGDVDYMEQLTVKSDLASYMLDGDEETWEMVDIDIEKIKKKMGLE